MLRPASLLLVSMLFAIGADAAVLTAQDRNVHAESQTIGYRWDENSNPVFPDFDPPTFTQASAPAVDDLAAADFTLFSATASTLDPALVILPLGTLGLAARRVIRRANA